MVNKICSNIIIKLTKNGTFSVEDKEKMIFTLSLILSDLSKIIILSLIFILLGNIKFFLITFCISTILRINIGGFHFKKYLSCLLFTSLYYLLLWGIHLSTIPTTVMFQLFIISLLIQLLFAPVVSRQRETIPYPNKKMFKIKALLVSIITFSLYIINNNPYAKIGVWIVIIQSLLILPQKGVKIYEKNIKYSD